MTITIIALFKIFATNSLFHRRLGWGHETLRLRGPWA